MILIAASMFIINKIDAIKNKPLYLIFVGMLSIIFMFNEGYNLSFQSISKVDLVVLTILFLVNTAYLVVKLSLKEIGESEFGQSLFSLLIWSTGIVDLFLLFGAFKLIEKKVYKNLMISALIFLLITLIYEPAILGPALSYAVILGYIILLIRSLWRSSIEETIFFIFLIIMSFKKDIISFNASALLIGLYLMIFAIQNMCQNDRIKILNRLKKKSWFERFYLATKFRTKSNDKISSVRKGSKISRGEIRYRTIKSLNHNNMIPFYFSFVFVSYLLVLVAVRFL